MTDNEVLNMYIENEYIDKIIKQIGRGKEAIVFLAQKNEKYYAIKIFREASNRSFKNRSDYHMQMMSDCRREARALKNKSNFGKKIEENLWLQREINALRILFDAGADVPKVICEGERSFMMECILDNDSIASRLADVKGAIPHPLKAFKQIKKNIELFLDHGIVHGDLSEYNILINSDGDITIIDFPQAVICENLEYDYHAQQLFNRDIENINRYFEHNCGFKASA